MELVDDTATFIAGGHDIWDNADQFAFLYKEISGDFDVSIIVESIELSNAWAKAGIMARQTLELGSINVLAAARANNDMVTFQRRDTTDGGSASERLVPDGQGFDVEFPTAIRLIKDGPIFTGDWGSTGSDWSGAPVTKDGVTPTPPIDLELVDPYYLGIAVTSHAEGVMTEAVVEILNNTPMAVDASGKLTTTWAAIRRSR